MNLSIFLRGEDVRANGQVVIVAIDQLEREHGCLGLVVRRRRQRSNTCAYIGQREFLLNTGAFYDRIDEISWHIA